MKLLTRKVLSFFFFFIYFLFISFFSSSFLSRAICLCSTATRSVMGQFPSVKKIRKRWETPEIVLLKVV